VFTEYVYNIRDGVRNLKATMLDRVAASEAIIANLQKKAIADGDVSLQKQLVEISAKQSQCLSQIVQMTDTLTGNLVSAIQELDNCSRSVEAIMNNGLDKELAPAPVQEMADEQTNVSELPIIDEVITEPLITPSTEVSDNSAPVETEVPVELNPPVIDTTSAVLPVIEADPIEDEPELAVPTVAEPVPAVVDDVMTPIVEESSVPVTEESPAPVVEEIPAPTIEEATVPAVSVAPEEAVSLVEEDTTPVVKFIREDGSNPERPLLTTEKQYYNLLQSRDYQEGKVFKSFEDTPVTEVQSTVVDTPATEVQDAAVDIPTTEVTEEALINNGLLEPPVQSKEQQLEMLMAKASDLYKQGKLDEAQAVYEQISLLNNEAQESTGMAMTA